MYLAEKFVIIFQLIFSDGGLVAKMSEFLNNMDWQGLMMLLVSAAAALACITLHELSHGYVAYRLGDPTAKNAGRLTLNPIKHIDLFGFLMMLVAHVGWAKPVPGMMAAAGRPFVAAWRRGCDGGS